MITGAPVDPDASSFRSVESRSLTICGCIGLPSNATAWINLVPAFIVYCSSFRLSNATINSPRYPLSMSPGVFDSRSGVLAMLER